VDVSFKEFLNDAIEGERDHWVMGPLDLVPGTGVMGNVARDLGPFRFLKKLGGRMYPANRAFFYAASFTDWHFHHADETLMCQILGQKEVVLLPPNNDSWDLLDPILNANGCTFDRDNSMRFDSSDFLRATVNPGDALYIPVFWWHAVQCREVGKVGITVASTFPSPLANNLDLRFHGARDISMRALKTFYAPVVILGVAWWIARRFIPDMFLGKVFHDKWR
jgi:Cupin-like domain